MGASMHAEGSPACCVGPRGPRGLRGIASARESYARAGCLRQPALAPLSRARCDAARTAARAAPHSARAASPALAPLRTLLPSVHSLLSVSPRPRKGLLTLPAMPLQPCQAINSTGGGAEHEDPCEGAERTMLMMRCRRGALYHARSRGSIRVPDRSVATGVESVLASVTPRT